MATWQTWWKKKRLPCRKIRRSLCMPSRGACQWSERLRNLRRTWLWKTPANPQACRLRVLTLGTGLAKSRSHSVQTRVWLVHVVVLEPWSKYRARLIWNLNKFNKYSKQQRPSGDFQLRRMRVTVGKVVPWNSRCAPAARCSSFLSKIHQRRPDQPI